MDDLVPWRQHQFEHITNQAIDIVSINLVEIVLSSQDTTMLQAFDMLASNTDVYGIKINLRRTTRIIYGLANSINGFFDVRNNR